MGRHTGPKGRINRRLGVVVYDAEGAITALRQRPHAPGMHPWRRAKVSAFALGLKEKQKIKHYYGLRERQLLRYVDEARRSTGDTGLALLLMLEQRLDNAVWRAGLCVTRSQARQAVAHGHFLLDGQPVKSPGQLLRVGQKLEVRPRLRAHYEQNVQRTTDRDPCFLTIDREGLSATVVRAPLRDDVALEVDVKQVVELLSK